MRMPHILLYSILLIGFTLGVFQGKLALWKDSQKSPVTVFPLDIITLPLKDQQLLEEGIPIACDDELTARLEDYLS